MIIKNNQRYSLDESAKFIFKRSTYKIQILLYYILLLIYTTLLVNILLKKKKYS